MKKKIIALFLSVTMICSFTACGNKEEASQSGVTEQTMSEDVQSSETDDTSKSEESSEEVASETSEDNTAAGESADNIEEEATGGPYLQIIEQYYEEEDAYLYLTGSFQDARIVGDNFPELKEAVDSWADARQEEYFSFMAQTLEDAKLHAEESPDSFAGYESAEMVRSSRLDSKIASLVLENVTYTGGAHGFSYLGGVTFDTKTGEEITFDMLGDIKEDVKALVAAKVEEKRAEGYQYIFYEDAIDGYFDNPAWYLSGLGLEVVFNPYDIGAYAEGRLIVTVPYDAMEDFNEVYLPDGNEMFTVLTPDESFWVDTDNDGTEEKITLVSEYDEDGNMQLRLHMNEEVVEFGYCAEAKNIYYVSCDNGRSFVLVSYDVMSDDYVTELVEIKDGKITLLDTLGGSDLQGMSNEAIQVEARVDALGTYRGSRLYSFKEGSFQPLQERFEFVNLNSPYRNPVVLLQDITAFVEREGALTEEVLSVGTGIKPINSDGESVIGFELEDGTYGEIKFERRDYEIYIDGVSEFELFENLPYAG